MANTLNQNDKMMEIQELKKKIDKLEKLHERADERMGYLQKEKENLVQEIKAEGIEDPKNLNKELELMIQERNKLLEELKSEIPNLEGINLEEFNI